ncbi:M81 family metallopeptidase [Bremerella sp. JC770]|uniref:M81 family metallopeptidase n=1 Tax=Bremerella sp. JC770 TaxID=3232137 RepID=UPI00345A2341
MRIGLVALLHESNTFAADRTTLDHFQRDILVSGREVLARFADAHHEMGGFIQGLREGGAEPVGVFAARALPSGTITAETFDELTQQLLHQLKQAGPLDGILVAPHGATVAENHPDADGAWLTEVRELVGPDMPIMGTLDPHANLSPAMVAATDALLAYQTNPHVDQQQRGHQAAQLMVRTVRGEISPVQAAAFPPLAISIERQCSQESPALEFLAEMERSRQNHSLLDASFFYGFPYADVPEMGSAVLCIADNNASLAQSVADELAETLWQRRADTLGTYCDIATAIQKARELEGPVCLLEMGDNIGAGSAAKATWIAQALMRENECRAFVALCDPAAVSQAQQTGIGASLQLSIGGQPDEIDGSPLEGMFEVVSLHAGHFAEEAPRHGGKTEFDMGPTAILQAANGMTLQVTTHRTAPWSLGQLTHCGLDPQAFQIIVAKGVNAPLAAYQDVCPHFIRVDTPGITTANMERLAYAHRRQSMYPFERDATWPRTQ